MATKRKRTELSAREKLDLLDKWRSLNCNQRQGAAMFGVSRTMFSSMIRQEEELRSLAEINGVSRKRSRPGKDAEVERKLLEWFKTENLQHSPIKGRAMCQKAEEIANMLGHHDFKATEGWFTRWKQRHGLSIKRTSNKGSNRRDSMEMGYEVWVSLKTGTDVIRTDPTEINESNEEISSSLNYDKSLETTTSAGHYYDASEKSISSVSPTIKSEGKSNASVLYDGKSEEQSNLIQSDDKIYEPITTLKTEEVQELDDENESEHTLEATPSTDEMYSYLHRLEVGLKRRGLGEVEMKAFMVVQNSILDFLHHQSLKDNLNGELSECPNHTAN